MKTDPQPHHGSWLVTISLSAAGILYLVFSFLPTSRAIGALREEINGATNYIEQASSLTLSLSQTQTELERTREYTNGYRQRLPVRGSFSALLGRITKQADMAGASTTRIEPQTATELDTLRVIPIVFSAKGSFIELSRLLAGLESLPERVWLEDVRLTAAREAGQKMECELRLVVFAGSSDNSD